MTIPLMRYKYISIMMRDLWYHFIYIYLCMNDIMKIFMQYFTHPCLRGTFQTQANTCTYVANRWYQNPRHILPNRYITKTNPNANYFKNSIHIRAGILQSRTLVIISLELYESVSNIARMILVHSRCIPSIMQIESRWKTIRTLRMRFK